MGTFFDSRVIGIACRFSSAHGLRLGWLGVCVCVHDVVDGTSHDALSDSYSKQARP
jgi:hypothetical protein